MTKAGSVRPTIDSPDLDLLRAFEPVVRYTRGESFLPMPVETYVRSAARFREHRGSADRILGDAGTLAVASLLDPAERAGRDYLSVAGSADTDELAALFRGDARQAVGFQHRGSRLARVGYTARLIDALFAISLLARGRVPGSLARRAVERYREMAATDERHPYYGRVVRTATWTALQYWFFYAFNDWRSGFNGANDHEADWEQIMVYLDRDAEGNAVPMWAAYAQHDLHGRDLRRRWDDDAQLDLVDDHPVVYAGAGSHASYFRPGEYMTQQELRLPSALRRGINAVARFMNGTQSTGAERVLGIAFVDYARGDGVVIGRGSERSWDPVVLDESQEWVAGYSGLWGLSVRDPFQGEDAPAGPMFNRDATVRLSWADPIAFAELDSEPPPSQEVRLLRARAEATAARQAELAATIPRLERELAATGAAGRGVSLSAADLADSTAGHDQLGLELIDRHLERETNSLRLADLRRRIAAAEAGERPAPQAHLRRIPVPRAPGADRAGVIVELWAAVSTGLLLLALVVALILAPRFGLVAAAAVIALFVLVEASLRKRVVDLVVAWVRLLAIVGAAILVVRFWQLGVIAIAVAAGLFVLRENVSELVSAARSEGDA